jgi:hypothetical protein
VVLVSAKGFATDNVVLERWSYMCLMVLVVPWSGAFRVWIISTKGLMKVSKSAIDGPDMMDDVSEVGSTCGA